MFWKGSHSKVEIKSTIGAPGVPIMSTEMAHSFPPNAQMPDDPLAFSGKPRLRAGIEGF